MRYLLLAVQFLFLAGCDGNPTTNAKLPSNTNRFDVISAQQFIDARYYARDILVLKDKQTGKEYLAVMGAGVTDMYPQGKHQVED